MGATGAILFCCHQSRWLLPLLLNVEDNVHVHMEDAELVTGSWGFRLEGVDQSVIVVRDEESQVSGFALM
jgi:hypothetical protein